MLDGQGRSNDLDNRRANVALVVRGRHEAPRAIRPVVVCRANDDSRFQEFSASLCKVSCARQQKQDVDLSPKSWMAFTRCRFVRHLFDLKRTGGKARTRTP